SFSYHHTASTQLYSLSLHDALPISFYLLLFYFICLTPTYTNFSFFTHNLPTYTDFLSCFYYFHLFQCDARMKSWTRFGRIIPKKDRKSTRLNSSHVSISYAVFCLKK